MVDPMATKRLHIDRTDISPEIDLDLEHGMIEFTGRSLPANGEQFYGRVYRWLEEYLKQPRPETVVNMKMDYLDTSSSKHFFNIFDKLNAVCERGPGDWTFRFDREIIPGRHLIVAAIGVRRAEPLPD